MDIDYVERVRKKPQPIKKPPIKKISTIGTALLMLGTTIFGFNKKNDVTDFSNNIKNKSIERVAFIQKKNYVHDFLSNLEDEEYFIHNKADFNDISALINNSTRDNISALQVKFSTIINKVELYKRGKSFEEKNKLDSLIRSLKELEKEAIFYIGMKED